MTYPYKVRSSPITLPTKGGTSLTEMLAAAGAPLHGKPALPALITAGLGMEENDIPGAKMAGWAGEAAKAAQAASEAKPGEELLDAAKSGLAGFFTGDLIDRMVDSLPLGGGPMAGIRRFSVKGVTGSLLDLAGQNLGGLGVQPQIPRSTYVPPPPPVTWSKEDIARAYTLDWRLAEHRRRGELTRREGLPLLSPEKEAFDVKYWVAMNEHFQKMLRAALEDARKRGVDDPYALPEIIGLQAHRDGAGRQVQESAKALDRMIHLQNSAARGAASPSGARQPGYSHGR